MLHPSAQAQHGSGSRYISSAGAWLVRVEPLAAVRLARVALMLPPPASDPDSVLFAPRPRVAPIAPAASSVYLLRCELWTLLAPNSGASTLVLRVAAAPAFLAGHHLNSSPIAFAPALTVAASAPRLAHAPLQATAARKAGGGKDTKRSFTLTDEQKAEVREAFDLFDTDGSGAWRRGAARRVAARSAGRKEEEGE